MHKSVSLTKVSSISMLTHEESTFSNDNGIESTISPNFSSSRKSSAFTSFKTTSPAPLDGLKSSLSTKQTINETSTLLTNLHYKVCFTFASNWIGIHWYNIPLFLKYCPWCGLEFGFGDVFCPVCGNKRGSIEVDTINTITIIHSLIDCAKILAREYFQTKMDQKLVRKATLWGQPCRWNFSQCTRKEWYSVNLTTVFDPLTIFEKKKSKFP